MFYPPAIREDAIPSSEVRDAAKKVEVASPSAALVITSPEVPAKESSPSRAAGTDEGQNPDTPKETVGFVGDDLVSHIEGRSSSLSLFSRFPLVRASKIPRSHMLNLPRRGSRPSPRSRPRDFFFFFLKQSVML